MRRGDLDTGVKNYFLPLIRGIEFGRCMEFSPAAMITPSMVVGENSNNCDNRVLHFGIWKLNH